MSRAWVPVLLLLLHAPPSAAWAEAGLVGASVADLRARVLDDELLVSFSLRGAFPPALHDRLHSGIPVSFRHRVEMLAKRPFFLAPARLLGRTVIETKVEYDSLTRQYRLFRRTESKTKLEDDPLIDLEVRRRTESLEEAVSWLTVHRDIPLGWRPDFAERERLRVRVSSNLGRRFVMLVVPSSHTVTAELTLEF